MSRPSRVLSAGSVGRGLAEVAIIVAGVLIALGADAWWTEREEDDLREEYRAALLSDLAADSMWYGGLLASGWLAESVEARDSLIAAALDGFSGSDGEIAGWLSRTPRLPSGDQTTGAYEELTATGRLALFEDPALRQAIVGYYGLDLMVDRDVYAVWVSQSFFPWLDRLQEMGGLRWYQGLESCLSEFDPRGPAGSTALTRCVDALPNEGISVRLWADSGAMGLLQDLVLTEVFLEMGVQMQATRDCLADWLRGGQRQADLCDAAGVTG